MTVLLMIATLALFLLADYVIQKRHPLREWRPDMQLAWDILPRGLQLAPNHLWLRNEPDGSATVGIDRFMSSLVGAPDAIALPASGAIASPDTRSITLLDGKKAISFAVPLRGTVAETNELITRNPRLVNIDPYGAGWLMRIRPEDPRGATGRSLMSAQAATGWLTKQIALVKEFLGTQFQDSRLALQQDGGVPVYGILRQCSGETWNRFEKQFATLKEQGEHDNA